MLQDMRHLIILDFRNPEDFKESHIRKSLSVNEENYQKCLVELIAAGPKELSMPYRS